MKKKKGAYNISNNDQKQILSSSSPSSEVVHSGNGMYIDPARIRFQHSRIRPFFSGCGRSVTATLEEIRNGTMTVSDLPPIQVIVGPRNNTCFGDDNNNTNEPWYFSLNNRRLWVLKRLREEGFLERFGNKVFVRVRMPKSQQEQERYCVDNCSLEAKIVPERSGNKKKSLQKANSNRFVDDDCISIDEKQKEKSSGKHSQELRPDNTVAPSDSVKLDDGDEDEDDDSDDNSPSNRFCALMLD
jgi:hypothetical protein